MARRFDFALENPAGLSMEAIANRFPTVFADEAASDRSARYLHIPTHMLIERLLLEGLVPVLVMAAASRKEEHQGHTRHLLRLRQAAELGYEKPVTREVVIINNSNGTGAYQFLEGLFRLVCQNGLISGDIDTTLKVRHVGRRDLLEDIVSATWQSVRKTQVMMEEAEIMRGIDLNPAERLAFADMAMTARFGEPALAGNVVDADPTMVDARTAFHPSQFLLPRRDEDRATDLFTLTNVAQEHLLRGGAEPRVRGVRVLRPITNVTDTVKINQMVWGFAEKVAEYKQSGILPAR